MLPFIDSLTNDQHKSVLETNDNFVDLQPPPTKKKERKKDTCRAKSSWTGKMSQSQLPRKF